MSLSTTLRPRRRGGAASAVPAAIDEAARSVQWKSAEFEIKGMRALPVVKQIVASLLALNAPGFGEAHPDLVNFVLDRHLHGLPGKYGLYLCLFVGPIARFAGLAAQLNVITANTVYITELGHPPFASVLTIDSDRRSRWARSACGRRAPSTRPALSGCT